jgi:hypothetical protein
MNYWVRILIVCFIFINKYRLFHCDQSCEKLMNCKHNNFDFDPSSEYMLCKNFDTNFTFFALYSNCTLYFENIYEAVIHPTRPQILSYSQFDFNGLMNFISITAKKYPDFERRYRIKFKNLLGIDLNFLKDANFSTPFQKILLLTFSGFKLNFYFNENVIDYCDRNLATLVDRPLFSTNKLRFVGFALTYSSKKICPYIFQNANIEILQFHGLSNNLLTPNYLKFDNTQDNFNSSIERVDLYSDFYRIDNQLINKNLFSKTQVFSFSGRILSIENQFFKSFDSLSFLLLRIFRMKTFFHTIPIDWMNSINSNLSVRNLSQITPDFIHKKTIKIRLEEKFISIDREKELYIYSDEDFCLFKEFPFDHLIYLIFDSFNIKKCSCTILYLIKDTNYYLGNLGSEDGSLATFDFLAGLFYEFCASSSELAKKCSTEIPIKLEMCQNVTLIHEKTLKDKGIDEWYMDFLVLKYICSLILTPIFCLIGILLNSLLVYVIRKKKIVLKENLYLYIDMNSRFNCIYCLISMLNLMNQCISNNGIYCSGIYKSYFAQYVKIIVTTGLGNMVKTCCNITYILILVNRYMLIGKEHSNLLRKISELSLKKVIIVCSIISFVLGIVNFFKYEINEDFEDMDYPFLSLNRRDRRVTKNNIVSTIIDIGLVFLNDLFNYFLFSISSQFIEILTFIKLKKTISKKEKHFLRIHGMRESALKEKSNVKREKNVIIMLTINCIINFTLRLPEISQLIYNILYVFFFVDDIFFAFCDEFNFFQIFIEISNFFFVLTFTLNFFILYRFNKNIRAAFNELFISRKKQ